MGLNVERAIWDLLKVSNPPPLPPHKARHTLAS